MAYSDLIIYYENSSYFLDIIGRSEAFSENRFQVPVFPASASLQTGSATGFSNSNRSQVQGSTFSPPWCDL
jgi:hypothetical protein